MWKAPGYFVKHDISALGYIIPLGHGGDQCPAPSAPTFLIIADTNGIHATRVKHCNCEVGQHLDKWTRLFMNDFFPSTVADPQSVFTFQLLRQYSILTLQAKVTAYDYMKTLRRLTDNVFTGNVPASDALNPISSYSTFLQDLYKQFRIVVRVWDLLSVERRSGVHHALAKTTSNDLIVECPACPAAGLNMEPGWEDTPRNLRFVASDWFLLKLDLAPRHLHQTRLTLDGNYQANHFARKNMDPNDVSLWAGRGYLPVAAVYNAHCGLEEACSTEVSCPSNGRTRSLICPARNLYVDISRHSISRTKSNSRIWTSVASLAANAVTSSYEALRT